MQKQTRNLIVIFAAVVIVAAGLGYWGSRGQSGDTSGRLDGFAQCLEDKGAVFYGAFWCHVCKSQKKLFGSSEKYLPYVECSTPNGQSQTQTCTDKGIQGYPTWIFADGSQQVGEIPLETLAEKTSCELPPQITTQ